MKAVPIIIKDVSIISQDKILENKTILIDQGIIQYIRDDIHQIPYQYEPTMCNQINGKGKYISPGLIDNHVHLILNGFPNIIDYVNTSDYPSYYEAVIKNAQQSVENGITTLVDMGDTQSIIRKIKTGKKIDTIPSSRLFFSGNMISVKQGHVKTIARTISTDQNDIKKAIYEQITQGNHFLKIIVSGGLLTEDSHPLKSEMDKETISYICKQAKKYNIPVAAHVYSDHDIHNAITAGVSRIEHGTYASYKTLQKAAQKNIAFTPTLKSAYDIISHKDELPSPMVSKAELVLSKSKDFIKNVKTHQISLVMGTDAGTPYNFHGDNAKELEYLVENGFSNKESILSATSNAARLINMENQLGDVKENYFADLILLDKNPIDDITAYQHNIKQVISKGKLITYN